MAPTLSAELVAAEAADAGAADTEAADAEAADVDVEMAGPEVAWAEGDRAEAAKAPNARAKAAWGATHHSSSSDDAGETSCRVARALAGLTSAQANWDGVGRDGMQQFR
jgi:hypothetical protein